MNQFLNRLKILRSLDRHELPGLFLLPVDWENFRDDPFLELLTMSRADQAIVWAALEKRESQ